MSKFFSILAASVGGGLVLGASIRLGEAIGSSVIRTHEHPRDREPVNGRGHAGVDSQSPVPPARDVRDVPLDPLVAARLARLEEKMAQVSSGRTGATSEPAADWNAALSGVVARMDRQQAEVETMRHQMSKATQAMDSVSALAEDLRSEMHRTISQDLERRLTAIGEGFQASVEAANKKTADAMVSSIETRITPRISRLEADLAGQTSAVSELRECALQSEHSIQRLLGVLERVMNPPGPAPAHELFRAGNRPGETADDSGEARDASSFGPLNPVIGAKVS